MKFKVWHHYSQLLLHMFMFRTWFILPARDKAFTKSILTSALLEDRPEKSEYHQQAEVKLCILFLCLGSFLFLTLYTTPPHTRPTPTCLRTDFRIRKDEKFLRKGKPWLYLITRHHWWLLRLLEVLNPRILRCCWVSLCTVTTAKLDPFTSS